MVTKAKEVIFGIRPEDIQSEQIFLDSYPKSVVRSEVVVSELLGAETMLYSKVGDTEFIARVDARDYHNPGETVELGFNNEQGSLLRSRNRISNSRRSLSLTRLPLRPSSSEEGFWRSI